MPKPFTSSWHNGVFLLTEEAISKWALFNLASAITVIRQYCLHLLKKNKSGTSENVIKKLEQDIQKIIDQYTKLIKDISTNI